ncbi:MAG: hypothetical protein ABI406_17870 [Ktedonobacteraceae bacterium]
MRCTHCDLPLSPTSTARVCPRCHMPVVTGINTAAKSKRASMAQPPSWDDGVAPHGWQENSGTVAGTPPPASPFPMSQQAPYPQPGQMWLPTPPSLPAQLPDVTGSHFSGREVGEESRPLQQPSNVYTPETRRTHMRTSNVGFIIAGSFVLTGGLLLILVYFLAAGLSPSTVQTQSITAGNSVTKATRHQTPTAVVPTGKAKPSPAATSGAFPAEQYITDPQMASAVNTSTAQVIQAATTFKVGQKVYVTFTIHPNGRSGAVCLQWYANTRTFSNFEFSISPGSTVAYSYTYYATSGPAHVEIYWASSVSCSDELLAQRINFTVVH